MSKHGQNENNIATPGSIWSLNSASKKGGRMFKFKGLELHQMEGEISEDK